MERLERTTIQQLRQDLEAIWRDGAAHLESLQHIGQPDDMQVWRYNETDRMNYALPAEIDNARSLRTKLADFGTRLMQAVRSSALLEQTDETVLRRNLRKMSSALVLRKYVYHESYVINDEERFCGIQPAEQSEEFIDVVPALAIFNDSAAAIDSTMELIAPTPENLADAIVSSQGPGLLKVRPNTAFIMMQINEGISKLEDINNTIKKGFREYGINAVRADEIQHSGEITQRILNEISTSQFLIADLTGERPSVYYEVGYAHAIGKNPILFREKGSPLHFDLLVHNVPEYKNITQLEELLRERLKAMTGRNPKE
jgi:hypothetical protein